MEINRYDIYTPRILALTCGQVLVRAAHPGQRHHDLRKINVTVDGELFAKYECNGIKI